MFDIVSPKKYREELKSKPRFYPDNLVAKYPELYYSELYYLNEPVKLIFKVVTRRDYERAIGRSLR